MVVCGATPLRPGWCSQLQTVQSQKTCLYSYELLNAANKSKQFVFICSSVSQTVVCVNWPLRTATWVPPHAAWTTFPQPFRGRSRGELSWKKKTNKSSVINCCLWTQLLLCFQILIYSSSSWLFSLYNAATVFLSMHPVTEPHTNRAVFQLHVRVISFFHTNDIYK